MKTNNHNSVLNKPIKETNFAILIFIFKNIVDIFKVFNKHLQFTCEEEEIHFFEMIVIGHERTVSKRYNSSKRFISYTDITS